MPHQYINQNIMKRILLALSALLFFTLSYAQTIYITAERPILDWERNVVVFNVLATSTIESSIQIDVRLDGGYNYSESFDIYSTFICQSGLSSWTFEVPIADRFTNLWEVDFVCDVMPDLPFYEGGYIYEEAIDSFTTESMYWKK